MSLVRDSTIMVPQGAKSSKNMKLQTDLQIMEFLKGQLRKEQERSKKFKHSLEKTKHTIEVSLNNQEKHALSVMTSQVPR